MKIPACFDDRETRPIIEELCKKNGIDLRLLIDLCEKIDAYSGSGRRHEITLEINEVIDAFIERSTEWERA
jgi:hypothetical protein